MRCPPLHRCDAGADVGALVAIIVLVIGVVYLLWASWDGYQREKGNRR